MTVPVTTSPAPALPEVFGMLPRFPARMRDWTPAHRSRAAKWGWSHRKNPRVQAAIRLNALLARTDPSLIRLYHCDLASEALATYAEHCPGDPRPATALWVARRYAVGKATEAERLGASRMIIAMLDTYPERVPSMAEPSYKALNVISWALYRNAAHGLRYASSWLSEGLEAGILEGIEARIKAAE